ncbi:unnamed protein product, partial [Effrenium voratum]
GGHCSGHFGLCRFEGRWHRGHLGPRQFRWLECRRARAVGGRRQGACSQGCVCCHPCRWECGDLGQRWHGGRLYFAAAGGPGDFRHLRGVRRAAPGWVRGDLGPRGLGRGLLTGLRAAPRGAA